MDYQVFTDALRYRARQEGTSKSILKGSEFVCGQSAAVIEDVQVRVVDIALITKEVPPGIDLSVSMSAVEPACFSTDKGKCPGVTQEGTDLEGEGDNVISHRVNLH
jgi:hypothetical protein